MRRITHKTNSKGYKMHVDTLKCSLTACHLRTFWGGTIGSLWLYIKNSSKRVFPLVSMAPLPKETRQQGSDSATSEENGTQYCKICKPEITQMFTKVPPKISNRSQPTTRACLRRCSRVPASTRKCVKTHRELSDELQGLHGLAVKLQGWRG